MWSRLLIASSPKLNDGELLEASGKCNENKSLRSSCAFVVAVSVPRSSQIEPRCPELRTAYSGRLARTRAGRVRRRPGSSFRASDRKVSGSSETREVHFCG